MARRRSLRFASLRPEQLPDEELLDRCGQGDSDAFRILMQRHEDRVFAIALRMTGSRADALDATQEAFIAAYRRLGSFRRDSAFSTWIYRIAVNTSHDLLRKRKRTATDELPQQDKDPSQVSVEDTAGLRTDLARALAELPAEHREAVLLHDLGGVPYDEIATLTGVALGTVKSRISRGRGRLAQLLEPDRRSAPSKEVT